MRGFIAVAAVVSMAACPAQAADLQVAGEVRAGAFLGARVRLPLGSDKPVRPQASLAVVPTQSYAVGGGRTATRMGEGVSLGLANRKLVFSIGGVPAAMALGLRKQGDVEAERKLGISTAGWIGIGALVAVGTFLVVSNLTCIGKDKDFCGSD